MNEVTEKEYTPNYFKYKDKLYYTSYRYGSQDNTTMKVPNGDWVPCVEYRPTISFVSTEDNLIKSLEVDYRVKYIRERGDFEDKFTPLTEEEVKSLDSWNFN